MDAILSEPTEHCHAPNLDQLPVVELKHKIKSRAADSEEATSNILYSAMRYFPLGSAGQLPRTETLLRTIRRQRQDPKSTSNGLADHLRQTDRGENFVLHEDNDLFIFTTTSNLSILKTCKHWFADGTFKVIKNSYLKFLLNIFHFRFVRMIFIKCLHYMDYLNRKLFHWYMDCL